MRKTEIPRARLTAPWWRRFIAWFTASDIYRICSKCGSPRRGDTHVCLNKPKLMWPIEEIRIEYTVSTEQATEALEKLSKKLRELG